MIPLYHCAAEDGNQVVKLTKLQISEIFREAPKAPLTYILVYKNRGGGGTTTSPDYTATEIRPTAFKKANVAETITPSV